MTAAIAVIVFIAGTAHAAAAQTRDSAAPATGTAAISGRVLTEAQPSQPVRRAVVTINSADRTIGRTVITDDAGRFVVPNLPAGRYNVGATRKGWVPVSYGARTPLRPGRSIAVADGERVTVTMQMSRTAAITGVVLDQNGQPPPALTMRVFRYGYSPTGERTLVFASGNSSGPDERGVYRIYGLAPGEYYVTAASSAFFGGSEAALHLTSDVDVQEALRAVQSGPGTPMTDVAQRGVALAPMFYPGTANPAQAAPVTVRAGEERAGIDFTVQYVGGARITGTIQLPDGVKPESVRLNLVNSNPPVPDIGFSGMRNAGLKADSSFEFTDIVPGQYSIGAHASATRSDGTSQIISGVTEVDVQGEDVPGVSLQLQDGFTVSGIVRIDGTAPPPSLGAVRVMLQPVKATVTISSGTPTVGADGRFTLTAITPGRYRLTVVPPPPWMVRSSVVAGQDTLDVPIDLRQSVPDAVITLTDRMSDITGHVVAAAGAASDYSIILFPENRALWGAASRRIMSVRTANDGTFLFNRVPAGDYQIAAVDDVEQGEWYDPAFLQRLAPSAIKVTIVEGEKKVQDLKVGGGP